MTTTMLASSWILPRGILYLYMSVWLQISSASGNTNADVKISMLPCTNNKISYNLTCQTSSNYRDVSVDCHDWSIGWMKEVNASPLAIYGGHINQRQIILQVSTSSQNVVVVVVLDTICLKNQLHCKHIGPIRFSEQKWLGAK